MKITSSFSSCVAFALLAVASLQAQTVTGSGTEHTIPVWTRSSKLGDSVISESGTGVRVKGTVEGTSTSPSGDGVVGTSTKGSGVYGTSEGHGVYGTSDNGLGVYGTSKSNVGVSGESEDSYGVEGSSDSSSGVYGISVSKNGVKGVSNIEGGVVGESTNGDGMGGISCSSCTGPAAVVGIGKTAGSFGGNVIVTNELAVAGLKLFHIDHPLDPANKYLNHFSMESNEVLNSYSGNVTTDANGIATVELPDYFEALNKDYRYQLTVIGQFAQAIISEEIEKNRFVIRTDKPSVKVSWQVTGVRSDAYAKAHPVPVEQDKPEQERGYYLTPEVFDQPEERSIAWLYHGDLMREAKALEDRRQVEAAAARLQKAGVEASGHD